MKQTAAKIVVQVTHLSIYSADGGGWNVQGSHEKAIVLAYKWGLLRADPNPPFNGLDNMVRVPAGKTMLLHYGEEGGFILTFGDHDDQKIILAGTKVAPAPNNPQPVLGHTVYATDANDFTFSFHGHLLPETG